MTPGDDGARERVLAVRAEAVRRLASLGAAFDDVVAASAWSNADDEHDPEGATVAFERAQIGALARQARADLADADAALVRLDAGTYATCERCGTRIPAERLAVRPTTRRCVACAGRPG
ncbi:TraR/DksA C4-type zinc finger protein [Actinotalea ferrariae]|uniref:TraR/DksA family transcriptional regulator n=1 Tax=Actinotalea ferrariae TaxID=1386098 RepID=UPI001C8BA0A1|nr:TraR/DksA C4-type zinc finger protein [Actinotalea ferrariae]MBX9244464.1 TraR/DksA C4-type zinc finger protein [Actinotalea ferrariae]